MNDPVNPSANLQFSSPPHHPHASTIDYKTPLTRSTSKMPSLRMVRETPHTKALERVASLSTVNVILLFYRGEWCPFSTTWARGFSSIRRLQPRLQKLDATIVLVSSQGEHLEHETAEHFGFSKSHGLHHAVHFVNDPTNSIAALLNARAARVVVNVDDVPKAFGNGVHFEHGMVQPAIVLTHDLFGACRVAAHYSYNSSGPCDVNGEGDRPPACTTLRAVEQIATDWAAAAQCAVSN